MLSIYMDRIKAECENLKKAELKHQSDEYAQLLKETCIELKLYSTEDLVTWYVANNMPVDETKSWSCPEFWYSMFEQKQEALGVPIASAWLSLRLEGYFESLYRQLA